MESGPEFYKAKEVAELLGVDPKTVYSWVKGNRVAHTRTPSGGVRIVASEVRLMLAGQPVQGQALWTAQQVSGGNPE